MPLPLVSSVHLRSSVVLHAHCNSLVGTWHIWAKWIHSLTFSIVPCILTCIIQEYGFYRSLYHIPVMGLCDLESASVVLQSCCNLGVTVLVLRKCTLGTAETCRCTIVGFVWQFHRCVPSTWLFAFWY
jgi:hypothetical protein